MCRLIDETRIKRAQAAVGEFGLLPVLMSKFVSRCDVYLDLPIRIW